MLNRAIASVIFTAFLVGWHCRAAEPLDFNRDVQPILAEACFRCHGPDAAHRKGDLRLDTQAGALAAHEGRAAVAPGKPEASELVRRILLNDPDEQMPPPDEKRPLSAAQKEILQRWVREGAAWGKHWSLVAPKQPPLPSVQQAGWVRNPIDAFILARLEKEGLKRAAEANKERLIRRLSLDLTGLPPTPEEVDAFLADTAADAYEKLVDRLLASPRYGERMVLEWLDAARYADTNGYQEDRTRTLWPWRDWVIDAMNKNMPFDQFTVEQLAGDLLPEASQSQRLATGFHRNHMLNGEGGRVPEESRIDYVVDRVDTTATVWLGLTLGCSRCHDHKYDPFTQKEYYQLFAFFNNVPETGSVDANGNAAPVLRIASPAEEQQLAALRENIKQLEARRREADARLDLAQAEWESKPHAPGTWTVGELVSAVSQAKATLTRQDDGSILSGGEKPVNDVHELVLKADLADLTGLRLEALGHESLPHGGPGQATENGNFVLTGLEGEVISADDGQVKSKLVFVSAEAEYSQPGWDVRGAIDADAKSGWAVMSAPKRDTTATFTCQPVKLEPGSRLRLRLRYESVHPRHVMGRFRISHTSGELLPADVAAALAVARDKRDPKQQQVVRDHFSKQVSADRKIEDELAATNKQIADLEGKLPQSMVMQDSPTPRASHVLLRGAWDKPGEAVTPGVPTALPALPEGTPKNRLGLARWLVDPANPLTARVVVNRYWQTFFGTGLVKTAEDFGVQGEKPSHPELVDWLAAEFLRQGWNVKAMHRLIVTSATYRQSSQVTPLLVERDPENRLLARGARYRLSAFALRDQVLFTSGLLVEQVGGPPVKPYQPPGIWEEFSFGKISYQPDAGPSLYRRSLYTFWRRTVGPPTLFDTPSRQVCTVRQPRTNTPLQSLVLLNETGFVEAARVLAERLLLDAKLSRSERIAQAFRLATARQPNEAEQKLLDAALQRVHAQFSSDPQAAAKLVAIGARPRDAKLNAVELAAYATVVNLIFNLDETLSKE